MDCDRVLVMRFGNMVELDHPHKLIQNEYGIFTKMIEETGPIISQQLKNVALQSFRRKSN